MTIDVVVTGPRWSSSAPDDGAPQAALPNSADLVVVGLGAAGLAAAAAAAARGLRVVGVNAGSIGGGASGRNGGFLLAGGADPHHVLARRLGRRRATALHRRTLEALAVERDLRPQALIAAGSIRRADDDAELADCAAQAAAMRRDGLTVEEADGRWGRGLWFSQDAGMDPGLRCGALAGRARADGAALHAGVPVTIVEAGRVLTRLGTIAAPYVLVAVDGGLERLVDGLGVRTVRNQMLATAPSAVDLALVPAPVYARWGFDYWQRLPDGGLVVGGARDRGGPEEETGAEGVTGPVQGALERIARDDLGVTAPVTHRWSGALGFTEDRMPRCRIVADTSSAADGGRVAAAGGYSGVGNLLGPICAVAAVGLLLDGRHSDAELLDRTEPWTGTP